jgi:predicted nucleotidyltransferase
VGAVGDNAWVDPAEELIARAVAQLRRAGAVFAFLHGSRSTAAARPDSDVDLAAWWRSAAPESFEVDLPRGVDLLVLNRSPLELAGRVALAGRLVFDDDPAARVRWVATTRKIYDDERPRLLRAHREFLESRTHG